VAANFGAATPWGDYLCLQMMMLYPCKALFGRRLVLCVTSAWLAILAVGLSTGQPVPRQTVAATNHLDSTRTGVRPSADSIAFGQTPAQLRNPFLQINGPLEYGFERTFTPATNDYWFYTILVLLLLLGSIRGLFWKYFIDLFQVFSQSSFRQKSIREQLLQNRTASMALNAFFGLSAGLFLYQVALYKHWIDPGLNWTTLLLCVGVVLAVYGIKYLSLKLSGWLLGMGELIDTYVSIVFLINKLVGILVLPATILLAFGGPQIKSIALVLTVLLLGLLYLYRYFVAAPLVRVSANGSSFHFFIYLCGFEIMPMLIVYKLLLGTIV
jgi:hypothetical protein